MRVSYVCACVCLCSCVGDLRSQLTDANRTVASLTSELKVAAAQHNASEVVVRAGLQTELALVRQELTATQGRENTLLTKIERLQGNLDIYKQMHTTASSWRA